MTDKEKLEKVRAKIERRKKIVEDNIFELGNSESERIGLFDRKEIYNDLLSFMDSMQEESVSPCENCEGDGLAGTCASISELGRCPLKYRKEKETVNEDLEKEIERWAETFKHNPAAMGYKETAQHFAEWQKQQLMAKVVDAQCFGFQGDALFSFRLPSDKYLVGSKVKVIVIKEN